MSAYRSDVDLSDRVQAFASALKALHLQAGKPSMRVIANAAGNISHTTVADVIGGRRIPSWSIVQGIVRQLKGDEGEFRDLWMAATDETVDSKGDSQAELEFLSRYRQQVVAYYGELNVPDFSLRRHFPIRDLYVEPTFKAQESGSRVLHLSDLGQDIHRAVLLGDPGSGKTSVCHMLMYQRAVDHGSLIPFFISLRNFSMEVPTTRSVVGFIEQQLDNFFQCSPPVGFISRLMSRGRAFVIFDALDEVVDVAQRARAASVIEMFSEEFSSVSMLVTSRISGYSEVRLSPSRFTTYLISEFDDEQASRYVYLWFSRLRRDPSGDPGSQAQRFMRDTTQMADLRSNPLLLAFMCTFYREDGSILRRLPELYEKSFELITWRWDHVRGIEGTKQEYVQPILRRIAFWFLMERDLRPTATHMEIIEFITRYLVDRVYEDSIQAEAVAREIWKDCSIRARIFREVGRNSSDEGLYSFAYRTFLEYFAASHLARQYDTPEDLARVLAPKLAQQQWVVIGQLVLLLVDRMYEVGAERLVSTLDHEADGLPRQRRQNLGIFLAQCLEFVQLSPALVRKLTKWSQDNDSIAIGSETSTETVGYHPPIASRVAGITPRQLDYWARTGLVVPSVRAVDGEGISLYAFVDILALKVIKRLLDVGVSLQNIRVAVEHLRRHDAQGFDQITLFSDGTTVYEATSPEDVVDLLREGRGLFGIAISGVVREVSESVREYPAVRATRIARKTRGFPGDLDTFTA